MRIGLVMPQLGPKHSTKACFPDMAGVKRHKPDVLVFPEQFIFVKEKEDMEKMERLGNDMGVPCVAGLCGPWFNDPNIMKPEQCTWMQYLLQFPDCKMRNWYRKHTIKGSQYLGWWDHEHNPNSLDLMGPFLLPFGKLGMTICHDLFLGGLYHGQKKGGAKAFVNATHYKVQDAKWGTLARMRALENSLPILITVHGNNDSGRHHPFAFDANGQELSGIRARDGQELLAGEMQEAGETYIFDLPESRPLGRLKAVQKLPACRKKAGENCRRNDSVLLEMNNGWLRPQVNRDDLDIYRIEGMDLLDFPKCFNCLDQSYKKGGKCILWNDWGETDPPVDQWLHVLMARALEFSVPLVLTAKGRILEIVERASDHKQIRRCTIQGDRGWAELRWADALRLSFNIVCDARCQDFGEILSYYRKVVKL